MWYVFLAALIVDIVLLALLIKSVSEVTLGAYASRIVAVLLAAFAFYSPAAVLKSVPVPVEVPIIGIDNRWVRYGLIAAFAAALAWLAFMAWQKRAEEFKSVISAGWRFAAIGALAIAARILIPRVI